jgi:plastocyanin
MLKNKILGVGFIGAVLVMLAIGIFTLSFKAHAAASTVSAAPTVHAYIVSTKSGPVFKRTTISISVKATFEFTNDTIASQTVTSKGKTVVTVASKASTAYTFKAAGTYVFSLASNTKATLTVTVK